MATASACLCIFLASLTGRSDATRTRPVCSNVGEDVLLDATPETGSHEAAVSPLHGHSDNKTSIPDHQKLPTRMASVAQFDGDVEAAIRVDSLQTRFTTYVRERFTDINQFNRLKKKIKVVLVYGAAAWASGSLHELRDLDCWVYGIRKWKKNGLVTYRADEEVNQMQRAEERHGADIAFPEINGWDPISDKNEDVAKHFEDSRDVIYERDADKVVILKMGWAEQLAFKLALITGGRGMQNGAYKIKESDIKDLMSAVLGMIKDNSETQLELWKSYVQSQADNQHEVFTKRGFNRKRTFVFINEGNTDKVQEFALSEIFDAVADFHSKWQDPLAPNLSDHVG